ncbi:MAG: tRNA (adenosine(37)-N6)-dimethylallyltransferase MiaA [Candidatus Gracilibacteria bacterium]|nr:tRNA (adenosine(37)-N6)-dimethylallyltransferase MiaA [Candidatus Gracilibacteria bacterium]
MIFIEKVKCFLENNNLDRIDTEKKKIIVIYGPTASGKTSLSIEMAKYINSEIISTDSRQIFKGLDIGTGKVTNREMEGIIHHMIDIITPDKQYSVGEFKKSAEKIIEDIHTKGRIPILCGGTGLYIDSLIYDFKIPEIPADEQLRTKLEQEALKNGNEYVYNKLVELDSEYAKELHPNNTRYVIRALEVKMLTGKSKSEFREEKILKYDTLFLTPYNGNREELYKNIDKRVKYMFDNGLLEEVKELLKTYERDSFGLKTIGYKEVVNYLLDLGIENTNLKKLNLGEKEKHGIKLNLSETIDLVQKNNRNYAKKQLTWFRKYEPEKNI